jgi:hypothetical protein
MGTEPSPTADYGGRYWEVVKKGDKEAVALANRHYSRLLYGKQGTQLGPPGRLRCFATADRKAVWVSHWPYGHLALDGLDAFRCTMFRNESDLRSSDLIRAAMALTEEIWLPQGRPSYGWITWIDPAAIQSEVPGYCFRRAGWRHDRSWVPSRGSAHLIRLWAALRG